MRVAAYARSMHSSEQCSLTERDLEDGCTFTHRDYLIDCSPTALADGRFAACAVMRRSVDRAEVEVRLTPVVHPTDMRSAAARAGLAAAIDWIDNNG